MKQSAYTDKQCIERIVKYINAIDEAFKHFNIKLYDDLEKSTLACLAITQSITNISELKKHIRQETLEKIPTFDKIKITAARNIASHDYESVNFKIIYDICNKLLKVREALQDECNTIQ